MVPVNFPSSSFSFSVFSGPLVLVWGLMVVIFHVPLGSITPLSAAVAQFEAQTIAATVSAAVAKGRLFRGFIWVLGMSTINLYSFCV